jgi:broad specificity phosphatase PhoE
MAQRLELVAHGLATGMRESIFGAAGHLLDPGSIAPVDGRVEPWFRGPERACAETAAALGNTAEVIDALGECDFGSWTSRSLADVGAEDPNGVRQWLNDPHANPHGGESLAQLVSRVGATIDRRRWPEGGSLVVVTPLVVGAIMVHVLSAPPTAIFKIDVPPLARLVVSRSGDFWRLRLGP